MKNTINPFQPLEDWLKFIKTLKKKEQQKIKVNYLEMCTFSPFPRYNKQHRVL